MDHYRGVGIVFLRKFIKAHGRNLENQFVHGLNEEQAKIFINISNNEWISVLIAAQLFEKAAQLLYPGDPKGFFYLGRERAKDNFSGIYQSLFKITTIPFLMKRAAKIWEASYEKGYARVEKQENENIATFIVTDYPEFSPIMMDVGCGYIQGVMELTQAKNVRVDQDYQDPQALKWHITWD